MRSAKINIILFLYIYPNISVAEVLAKQGANTTGMEGPMSYSYVVQILISFLVVIAFILILAWLMRRTGRFGYGNRQIIKILSSISLGMREKILLIDVAGEKFVVGIGPGQIRTLHVLDSNVKLNDDELRSQVKNTGFKQIIDKFTKQ